MTKQFPALVQRGPDGRPAGVYYEQLPVLLVAQAKHKRRRIEAAGRALATYVEELNEGVEGFSPTRRVFINQDVLEPLLRERALELGATVRNRTEAVTLEQDDVGVTVTLRNLDSGEGRRRGGRRSAREHRTGSLAVARVARRASAAGRPS